MYNFKIKFCLYLELGYKTHTDCIEGGTDKRDRMGTILIYLETVAKGGETRFPGRQACSVTRMFDLNHD